MRLQNRDLLFHQRRNHRHPRQRRSDDRRVDLVVDLLRDVRLNRGLIDSVGIAPAQHLRFGQILVRRERTRRRLERRAAVAGAGVLILRAVAPPVGGNHDIGESAFGGLNEKAFDDPEDGPKLAGFEGLNTGGEFLDGSNQDGDDLRQIDLLRVDVTVFIDGIFFSSDSKRNSHRQFVR